MKITREIYLKMLHNNCDKSKHRFATNKRGVTFCVICGLLSNKPTDNKVEPLEITISH
jgi:uncharacterized Zn finger protein (UPF0148 family)